MATTYCDAAPGHEWHGPYHDREYGFPLEGDAELFERLVLEINQAGLSWLTILKKREAFRRRTTASIPSAWRATAPGTRAAAGRRRASSGTGSRWTRPSPTRGRILELRKTHGSFAGWLAAHHPRSKEEWVKLFKQTFRFTGGEIVGRVPDEHRLPARRARRGMSGSHRKVLAARPAWARS